MIGFCIDINYMVLLTEYMFFYKCDETQTEIPDLSKFPFVVIGNKIDLDGGVTRAVGI